MKNNDTTTKATMTASDRLAMVQDAWKRRATVFFGTRVRWVKVTARTAQKWEEANRPFARLSGSTLQIFEGRRYVDAMGCSIRIQEVA